MMKQQRTIMILKVALAFGTVLSLAGFASPQLLAAYAQNESLPAKNNNTLTANTLMQMTKSTVNEIRPDNFTAINTFSAEGTIGSVILSNMSTSSNNTSNATTTASVLPGKTFVLNGHWHLEVDNGNVTSFDARFTKVHLDATDRHTHEIGNFTTSNNSSSVKGEINGTTTISGTSDVALNNVTVWHHVKTTIIINDLSTITISLDPAATGNHFSGQSIYGVVNAVKDRNGNELANFTQI
jgi:hypothetical protein